MWVQWFCFSCLPGSFLCDRSRMKYLPGPTHVDWRRIRACASRWDLGEREPKVPYYCLINATASSFILLSERHALSVHLRSIRCPTKNHLFGSTRRRRRRRESVIKTGSSVVEAAAAACSSRQDSARQSSKDASYHFRNRPGSISTYVQAKK